MTLRNLILPVVFVIAQFVFVTTSSCHLATDQTVAKENAQNILHSRIQRGDYLVNSICHCMHCHANCDFKKFSGPVVPGTEGAGGEEITKGIFVKNITPYALGNWTDEEIYRVLTTGIRKNGDTLTIIMPFYRFSKMPKEEIYSIIAYLRTLKSIENKVPERKLDAKARAFWNVLYRNIYLNHSEEKIPFPTNDDRVQRGAYFVNIGNCNGCHTSVNPKKLDFVSDSMLSGGRQFKDSTWHIKVKAANLTPDSASGLGLWTEEMFLNKFKNFRNNKAFDYDPGKYNTVMPWSVIGNVNDDDLKAIYAYLRTIRPVTNKVIKYPE